jgi:general secretion pathway protein K
MRPADEKGAALLTVLLLVAVMSIIAVGVLDDIRFGVRRAANVTGRDQAQLYALGAEELARVQVARIARLDPERTTLKGDWNGRRFQFPIENGVMTGRISDATGCFNLNSVTEARGPRLVRQELGVRQFVILLGALGIPQGRGQTLADNLADWIDSDDIAMGGAEDQDYARAAPAYRTGGAMLAEVSELRAVRGFTQDVYARIRPFVCAPPTTDLSPINVNTLPPDRSLLITMVTLGAIPPEAGARLLAGRPTDGWTSLQAFWNEPILVDQIPEDTARGQIALRTRFFSLDADVTFAGSSATLNALLEVDTSGAVKLAARRWTRDE